jgi:uncharacterized protein (DUF433 family)
MLLLAGVPTVRGSRIPVRLIAQLYRAGDSVDDILRSYPRLSAAAVHDALSYYLDHTGDIEHEIAANRIERVLSELGGQVDERGFITYPAATTNG